MIIKYKNYTLEPCSTCPDRFDLYEEVTATVKGKKERKDGLKEGDTYTRRDEIGYSYTLEGGLNKIIFCEANKKQTVVDLKQFVDFYKAERNALQNILK